MAIKMSEAPPAEQIPILDMGDYLAGKPGAREELAAQLRHACENIGFFYVKNHGVPQSLVDAVFAEAARFHARPLEKKLELRINSDNIGYLPMASSTLVTSKVAQNRTPNLNEAFIIKRDRAPDDPDVLAGKPFRGLNQWPDDLPGFRETLVGYMNAVEALGKNILPLYAIALDMPAGYFNDHMAFGQPQISLRVSHYPPQPPDEEGFGSAPHTDYGFMTILAQSKVPGLEIRSPSGEWMRAPVLPEHFLVNTGDMCTRWSNDRFLSTPHRVINLSGGERYAIPFFFDPNTEAVIECLPTCVSGDRPARYPPHTYGDYYGDRIRRNYAHQKPPAEPALT